MWTHAHPGPKTRPGGRMFKSLGAAAAILAGSIVAAAPTSAATIVVYPGQSIQAAVDTARPGQTIKLAPGIYHESVAIVKDRITLEGSGSDLTTMEPAAQATDPCGSQEFGICVVGRLDQNNNVVQPVHRVRVSDLSVRHFSTVDQTGQRSGVGVFILGAEGTTVEHVVAADNGSFGVVSISSSGDRYLHDTATGSAEAGFHIAPSAGPGATLVHDRAYANRYGILVTSASGGRISHNELTDNCAGVALAGEGLVGGAATADWLVSDNDSSRNNTVCPSTGSGPGAEPPISGSGIVAWGVRDIAISHNTVNANRPGGPSAIAGGIVVRADPAGDQPTHITVIGNQAEANGPADIIWDSTGAGNTFTANDCETSIPTQLCR